MATSKKNTPKPFIIDDDTDNDLIFGPAPDGIPRAHGLVPRDYSIYPKEMYKPADIEIFTKDKLLEYMKENEAQKSTLAHVRDTAVGGKQMPCLDQGSVGYCWAHSTVHCVMLLRALSGQPYVPLSAYMVAAIIKKGRDEGGWCGLSGKFLRDVGVCSQQLWAQGDRNTANDNAACRENAALHKVTEDWMDLNSADYDHQLSTAQLHTVLVLGMPCAVDFNWWGHSVCALRPVEVEAGSIGLEILNSWGMQWGTNGTGILRGSKAVPDGAVCLAVTGPGDE
jgi:hypothetical protein